MTEEAWQGLVEQMRAGRIARLEDARAFLARRYGIVYHSVNGVWYQFQRRRTKWKTGRRRHQKADARQQEAFP
jgi:transposase